MSALLVLCVFLVPAPVGLATLSLVLRSDNGHVGVGGPDAGERLSVAGALRAHAIAVSADERHMTGVAPAEAFGPAGAGAIETLMKVRSRLRACPPC